MNILFLYGHCHLFRLIRFIPCYFKLQMTLNKMFCSIPQYLKMSRKLNKTATLNEEVDGITLGCLFSAGRDLNDKQDGMWVPPWICSQAKVALLRKVWLLIPTSMTKSESSKKQTGFRESVKIPGITLEPCKKCVA